MCDLLPEDHDILLKFWTYVVKLYKTMIKTADFGALGVLILLRKKGY
jgi:hypothetical protein